MKCPACGADNGPGRSTCSSCMKPLGNQAAGTQETGPRYRSWTEESGEKPAWQRTEQVAAPKEVVSAQNLDPALAQEYYRQQNQPPRAQNDSGSGAGAVAPEEAEGFNAGGCVPFGLFGFANGQVGLGILGLIGSFFPLAGLIYIAIVAFNGKKMAWSARRFSDVTHFSQTMEVWNVWGIILFFANFILGFYIGYIMGDEFQL